MGTEKIQPLTLICNYDDAKEPLINTFCFNQRIPKLYTLEFDTTDLKVLDIEVSIDWAFIIVEKWKLPVAQFCMIVYQKCLTNMMLL